MSESLFTGIGILFSCGVAIRFLASSGRMAHATWISMQAASLRVRLSMEKDVQTYLEKNGYTKRSESIDFNKGYKTAVQDITNRFAQEGFFVSGLTSGELIVRYDDAYEQERLRVEDYNKIQTVPRKPDSEVAEDDFLS